MAVVDRVSSCVCVVQCLSKSIFVRFFFFNDTATTEIYTLSLHDALSISVQAAPGLALAPAWEARAAELDCHQVCRPVAGSLQPVYRSAGAPQRPGLQPFFHPSEAA